MDGNFFATKIPSRTQNLGHAEGGMNTWECTKQNDTRLQQQIKGIFLNTKFNWVRPNIVDQITREPLTPAALETIYQIYNAIIHLSLKGTKVPFYQAGLVHQTYGCKS